MTKDRIGLLSYGVTLRLPAWAIGYKASHKIKKKYAFRLPLRVPTMAQG